MIFTIASIFGLVVLSFLILVSSSTQKRQKFYFVSLSFLMGVFIWVLNYSNVPRSDDLDILMNRLLYFLIPFITVSIYTVIRSMIENEEKINFLILVPLIISPLAFSDHVINGINYTEVETQFTLIRGFLFFPYLVISITPSIIAVMDLIKSLSGTSGFRKLKIQVITVSLLVVIIGMLSTNVILPIALGHSATGALAPIWVLFWVASLYYAMARYRLFGMRYISGKLLYFLCNSVFVFLLFTVGFFIHTTVWDGVYSVESVIMGLFISLLAFACIEMFMKSIGNFIDERFGFKDANTQTFLKKYLRTISASLDIETISDQTFLALKELLEVDNAGIVIFDNNSGEIKFKRYSEGVDSIFGYHYGLNELLEYWGEMSLKDILLRDELEDFSTNKKLKKETRLRLQRLVDIMEDEGIEAVLPLNRTIKLNGILLIKQREKTDVFSLTEIELLEQIISNVSVAFGRSVLYEEVRELTRTLQQKVNDATVELQEKVELLEAARRRERDMVDIMGHELRTPLSIIKIKQSLLRNKIDKGNYSVDDLIKTDQEINDALNREIELLETMLSSTKLDAGRMELHLEKVLINKLIHDSIVGHQEEAEDKELKIILNEEDKDIFVFADALRLGEVIDNFVSNAIKYTQEGSVTIDIVNQGDFARVSVMDTGIGIPKSAMKRLGEKWYRVQQYIENGDERSKTNVVRPGGTGLGLYVTYNLVELMGGKVSVRSKQGKGSTFSFTVPLFKGQKIDDSSSVEHNVFKRLGLNKS